MSPEPSQKPASTYKSDRPSGGYQPRPGGSSYQGGAGGRPGGSMGTGGPGGFRGRKPPPRRMCRVCEERKGNIDWKAINYLRSFVTDQGKVLAGRSKGTCSPCQRGLARAIKRARNMALLPTAPV